MDFDDVDLSRSLQRVAVQQAVREAAWDWLISLHRSSDVQLPEALAQLHSLLMAAQANESGSEAAWREQASLRVLSELRGAWDLAAVDADEAHSDAPPWLLALTQEISLSAVQGKALQRYQHEVREDPSMLCVADLQRRVKLGWQRGNLVMMALVRSGMLRLVPAEEHEAWIQTDESAWRLG